MRLSETNARNDHDVPVELLITAIESPYNTPKIICVCYLTGFQIELRVYGLNMCMCLNMCVCV